MVAFATEFSSYIRYALSQNSVHFEKNFPGKKGPSIHHLPKGSEGKLEGSEGLPKGSKDLPKVHERLPKGSGGLP